MSNIKGGLVNGFTSRDRHVRVLLLCEVLIVTMVTCVLFSYASPAWFISLHLWCVSLWCESIPVHSVTSSSFSFCCFRFHWASGKQSQGACAPCCSETPLSCTGSLKCFWIWNFCARHILPALTPYPRYAPLVIVVECSHNPYNMSLQDSCMLRNCDFMSGELKQETKTGFPSFQCLHVSRSGEGFAMWE